MYNEFEPLEDENYLNISTLYNLEPMGIGTSYIESLTSYLIRLANSHRISVGTLINKIIGPELNKEYILQSATFGGNRFYDGAKALNGTDIGSKDLVAALERLTSRSDLEKLTFNPWEHVITNRNLLKDSLSWCPECLNSFKKPYFPLIWSIRTIDYCTIHEKPLINKCFGCNRSIPILHRKSTIESCPYCNVELCHLKGNSGKILVYDNKREEFFVNNTRELVEFVEYLDCKLERSIIAKRMDYFNQYFKEHYGKSLREELALPKSTYYYWLKGKAIPTLENLLDFCYSIGISVIEFFFHNSVRPKIEEQAIILKSKTKSISRKLDIEILNEKLKAFLDIDKPLSMVEVSRQLEVDRRTLYRTFPDMCKAISSRYMEMIKNNSEDRRLAIKSLINESVQELLNNNLRPSQKNIEKHLSVNSLLREEFAKEYLNKLLEQI